VDGPASAPDAGDDEHAGEAGNGPGDAGEGPREADRDAAPAVSLLTIAREWGRIGCIGFGGPPAHIALLRRLCVQDRRWIPAQEFENGISATNLLPGPASTQLAIYCAWRLRRSAGAVVGGLAFIVPGLFLILALSAVFLAGHPPTWIRGAAEGLGAAVPAVALAAAVSLIPGSAKGIGPPGPLLAAPRVRWALYLVVGGAAAATIGPFLVVVLIACGVAELVARRGLPGRLGGVVALGAHAVVTGGLAAVAWVAFKVGALSFGGGFVIVPLMQADAVNRYHWMSGGQFLNAVALGQITPGPVVQTVSAVGYAAGGLGAALLAAVVAFSPSFVFVLVGGPHFDRLRHNLGAQAFLRGSGPAAIGAIAGSAIPLGRELSHLWQVPILVAAGVWLLAARRSVVTALLAAGVIGVLAALAGLPIGP